MCGSRQYGASFTLEKLWPDSGAGSPPAPIMSRMWRVVMGGGEFHSPSVIHCDMWQENVTPTCSFIVGRNSRPSVETRVARNSWHNYPVCYKLSSDRENIIFSHTPRRKAAACCTFRFPLTSHHTPGCPADGRTAVTLSILAPGPQCITGCDKKNCLEKKVAPPLSFSLSPHTCAESSYWKPQ